jgi:hypothetical protein
MSDSQLVEQVENFGELQIGRLFLYQATYIKTSESTAALLEPFLRNGHQSAYQFQPDVAVTVILVQREVEDAQV